MKRSMIASGVLRDPERHRAMSEAAAEKAQVFSAERIVPMYEELYREATE